MEVEWKRYVASPLLFAIFSSCGSTPPDAVEERTSALTTGSQGIFVPAYFATSDTTSWNNLITMAHQSSTRKVWTVVVNAGCESIPSARDANGNCISSIQGGPGTDYDADLQTLIGQIQGDGYPYGVAVLGYVDFKKGRPAADIQTDIDNWSYGSNHNFSNHYHGLDGIFFDESSRTDSSGLPKALYFNDQVQHHFTYGSAWMPDSNIPGTVVFNWGGMRTAMPSYADCLLLRHSTYDPDNPSVAWNYFVTNEAYLRSFDDNSVWPPDSHVGFMDPGRVLPSTFAVYHPGHFISIVHDFRDVSNLYPAYDNTTITDQTSYTAADVFAKARELNTSSVFVTDLLNFPKTSDPYATMPAASVFSAALAEAGSGMTFPNGSSTDQQSSSCPNPDPNE